MMLSKWREMIMAFLLVLSSFSLIANEKIDIGIEQAIKKQLATLQPPLKVKNIYSTPINHIFKVVVSQQHSFYVTADGRHVFSGDLFAIKNHQFVNYSQLQQQAQNMQHLAEMPVDSFIIYPAIDQVKQTLYIFVDADCPYCKKLHHEIAKLNQAGIEVRYIAYPREGLFSSAAYKLESVWCSTNKQAALNALWNEDADKPLLSCDTAPIETHFGLAKMLEVKGTPAIVLPDGQVKYGYKTWQEISELL